MFGRIRNTFTASKPAAKIIRVLSITPGGNHCWVDSDQGRIRKPLASVPKALLEDFRRQIGRG